MPGALAHRCVVRGGPASSVRGLVGQKRGRCVVHHAPTAISGGKTTHRRTGQWRHHGPTADRTCFQRMQNQITELNTRNPTVYELYWLGQCQGGEDRLSGAARNESAREGEPCVLARATKPPTLHTRDPWVCSGGGLSTPTAISGGKSTHRRAGHRPITSRPSFEAPIAYVSGIIDCAATEREGTSCFIRTICSKS